MFNLLGNSKKNLSRKYILIADVTEFLEGVWNITVEKSNDN